MPTCPTDCLGGDERFGAVIGFVVSDTASRKLMCNKRLAMEALSGWALNIYLYAYKIPKGGFGARYPGIPQLDRALDP